MRCQLCQSNVGHWEEVMVIPSSRAGIYFPVHYPEYCTYKGQVYRQNLAEVLTFIDAGTFLAKLVKQDPALEEVTFKQMKELLIQEEVVFKEVMTVLDQLSYAGSPDSYPFLNYHQMHTRLTLNLYAYCVVVRAQAGNVFLDNAFKDCATERLDGTLFEVPDTPMPSEIVPLIVAPVSIFSSSEYSSVLNWLAAKYVQTTPRFLEEAKHDIAWAKEFKRKNIRASYYPEYQEKPAAPNVLEALQFPSNILLPALEQFAVPQRIGNISYVSMTLPLGIVVQLRYLSLFKNYPVSRVMTTLDTIMRHRAELLRGLDMELNEDVPLGQLTNLSK